MKKTVFITGATSSIGKAIAKIFVEEGYRVVLGYHSREQEACKIQKELGSKNALVVKCDVTKETSVFNAVDIVMRKYGRIDCLVNNAAVEIDKDFFDKKVTDFKKTFDVNLIGAFLMSRAVGEHMLRQGSGVIINISSNNAFTMYDPVTLEYDASKAALNSLTKNLALQFAPYIRVNGIAPGWVLTPSIIELDKSLDGKFIEEESKRILLEKFASCEDVANVVSFLASEKASYINGEIIKVDGGVRHG